MEKNPRYHRSNTQEHFLIAFYTTLLQRRRTKRFLSTEKKLRAHPCLSSSHPPQWKRTPLHTMAPETLIFHTPCIWWHLQKQELCNNKSSVHSPSRQAGKVGHREPQNTQLQTHGSAFFFFPPQILNFSFDYSLPALQRGFKDFDVPKMRIRPGSKLWFMSCCWSPASTDQLPPRLWARPGAVIRNGPFNSCSN